MMIERRKMTRATYQALKRYILHEREKKKQEQEQDKAQERLRRERELQKKKEEEDSLTLEQTKEQLVQLEMKLDALKQEKHGLFSELKKVLHQENEMRQRAQMKEQNEIAALHQQQFATSGLPPGPVTGHPLFLQTNIATRPSSKYLNVTSHQPISGQGLKRQRSPSPPSAVQYSQQHYASQFPPNSLYSGSGVVGASSSIKQEPYSAASEYGKNPTKTESSSYGGSYGQPTGHSSYGSQQAPSQVPPPIQQYQQSSGQVGAGSGQNKYSTSTASAQSQSAFSTYPAPISAGYSIYQQQVQGKPQQTQSLVADQFAAYSRQSTQPRRPPPQSGYLSPHHGPPPAGQPLQQQLEHASQKAGFADVKSHQQAIRATVVAAQQQMASGHPPRGSIVNGYPIRPPPQQGPATSVYNGSGSGSLVPPRHNNHNQSRY